MKTIRVNITKQDIENGVPGTTDSCPVALACRRKLKRFAVRVGTFNVWLNGLVRVLPRKAVTFIVRFDQRKSVKPFSFMLKVP